MDTTRFWVEQHPETRERAIRLLEESPDTLCDADEIQIRITPRGGIGMTQRGPTLTLSEIIPRHGGIELLRYRLERMVSTIIDAKSSASGAGGGDE